MIDIHNHLIPGVDDGSDSLELSRKLLKDAVSEGITDVLITPHFMCYGPYRIEKQEMIRRFNEFRQEVYDLHINLYLGNELLIDRKLDELLAQDRIMTLNNSDYILVEFPFDTYKDDYDDYLYDLSLEHRIIIAHPERYDYVQKNRKFVKRWLENGYYLQCNQNSLFHSDTRKTITELISKGQVSLIASDAHSEHRPLSLENAYNFVSRRFDEETAELLMEINPRRILENRKLKKASPVKMSLF